MKLSESQQLVIDKMNEGWELGYDNYSFTTWLQKNGIGRGGETIDIRNATLFALYKKGLIQEHYNFPISKYTLIKST